MVIYLIPSVYLFRPLVIVQQIFAHLVRAFWAIRPESLAIFHRGLSVMGAVLIEEIFDLSSRICMIFAYALGSVALVSSVAALRPLIVLSYLVVLSLFWPGLIHEEIGRHTLALKLTAVILAALGIFLIQ